MLVAIPLRTPGTKKRLTATAIEEKLLGYTVSPDARKSEKSLNNNDRLRILRMADDYLRNMIDNDHNHMFAKQGITGHVTSICTYDAKHRHLCIEYTIHRNGDNPIHDTLYQCFVPNFAKYTLKQLYEIWVRHARAAIKS